MTDTIKFSYRSKKYAYLSNWYESDFTVDGLEYHHVEGYLQSSKFKGWKDKAAEHLRNIRSPQACRLAAAKYFLDEKHASEWKAGIEFVKMKLAVTAKFICDTQLRYNLVSTGINKLICEDVQDHDSNASIVLGEVLEGVRSISKGILSVETQHNIYATSDKSAAIRTSKTKDDSSNSSSTAVPESRSDNS